MLTKVMNLSDEMVAEFLLPPKEAVIAAYEQFSQENYNFYTYPTFENHPQSHEGLVTVACGNWVAMKKDE
jgi:hypothetical protein